MLIFSTNSAYASFTQQDAVGNLKFATAQYLKMLDNIERNHKVEYAKGCTAPDDSLASDNRENAGHENATRGKVVCFARAKEHGKIFMERPQKWTNGFFPGTLWKLLSASDVTQLSVADTKALNDSARFYQQHLASEAKRTSTHDLGFILFDSYGEALDSQALPKALNAEYAALLNQGRKTLMTRYSDKKRVIKSWDFTPRMRVQHLVKGKERRAVLDIRHPWTYPVIVDNMMNLEYLLTSDHPDHRAAAFEHALSTLRNHYFYAPEDKNQLRPIAYHLIDYGNMRAGNWQGMGNISAWARGQAWSLYGFVTVLEAALDNQLPATEQALYYGHIQKLLNTAEYYLAQDPVPLWDFFAANDDAPAIASNTAPGTMGYSRILDLCQEEIASDILPYADFGPISIRKNLFSDQALIRLAKMQSTHGEPFIQGDVVTPCGTKAYDLAGRSIPKDSSAATVYASGLYRLAQVLSQHDPSDKPSSSLVNVKLTAQRATQLADNIMLALSKKYRSDIAKGEGYKLGFVLDEATGNFPAASEINTAIVYGDFYFIEANLRKLALAGAVQ